MKLQIIEKINLLKALFKKVKLDADLQQVILSCITEAVDTEDTSERKLNYLLDLMARLRAICNAADSAVVNQNVEHLLLQVNLNTSAHVEYYKKKIALAVEPQYKERQKLENLWLFKKQFDPRRQRKGMYFDKQNRSIRTIMLDYLQAEIEYLEKQQEKEVALVQPVEQFSAGIKPVGFLQVERLKLTLSVDVLAFFLRLLLAEGVFSSSREKVLRFVAQTMETPGTSTRGIAFNSLDTKSKQVVQTSITALRAMLVRLIKMIDDCIF